jgi:hypothetical protein
VKPRDLELLAAVRSYVVDAACLHAKKNQDGEFYYSKSRVGHGLEYAGYFGSFFKFLQSKCKIMMNFTNGSWTPRQWADYFPTVHCTAHDPEELYQQPIIIYFVFLEILNSQFKLPNGDVFFSWYDINSVREFRNYFTVVLQTFLTVYSIVSSHENIEVRSFDEFKDLCDHDLFEQIHESVHDDQVEYLDQDNQWSCIKV